MRTGLSVPAGVTTQVERFVIQHSPPGIDYMGVTCAGRLTLDHVEVSHNQWNQAGAGGGIMNEGSLTMTDSTFGYNNASSGGGIFNRNMLTLVNSTLSGNTASEKGGGVYNESTSAPMKLFNTTLSANLAAEGGGVYAADSTTSQLTNSLLASNLANTSPDCAGSLTSNGYNLVGSTSGCNFAASTDDLTNTNAKIGLLIGPPGDPNYIPLLAGSPAIDAGNPGGCKDHAGSPLPTDQRGVSRVGHCDIGSYEYKAPGAAALLYARGGTPQHRSPLLEFIDPLQAAVLDAVGSPVTGELITFTAPGSGPSGTFNDSGSHTTTATTAATGIATAADLQANTLEFGSLEPKSR
jgi:hypothetical protein